MAREYVEGLVRGLAVIQSFNDDHAEMSLTEVAERTGLKPATARRCLLTLIDLGFVHVVRKRFMLSAHILTLGSAYLRAARVDDVLLPELQRLVAKYGDAASISILDRGEILYIGHYSEQRRVRPVAAVGMTYPAFATSMGRVLLSGLPLAEIEVYLESTKFEKFTELTEVEPAIIRNRILEARKRRYATVVDQIAYGVTSLAVPIEIEGGHIVAALNTSGYSGRLTPDELIQNRLRDLQASAAQIATMMNRYPTLLHSTGYPRAPAQLETRSKVSGKRAGTKKTAKKKSH
jgi:IclR family transcriptional regulator, pca regulon regulatory protein